MRQRMLPVDIINELDPATLKCSKCKQFRNKKDGVQYLGIRTPSGSKTNVFRCKYCRKPQALMYKSDVVISGEDIVKNRNGNTGKLSQGIDISIRSG